MDSNAGEGSAEELRGRKKSRFKILKTRLFGRLKRKGAGGLMKQSQSTSDVTAQEGARGGYDSDEDCLYSQGTLGSRALSHDSVFLADQVQASEPTRVLSQENVQGKIKALQLKLQQQNMRLGPPPLLIPGKRTEDSGATSEDDGLPHSPPEMSFHEGVPHRSFYKHADTHRHLSSLSLAGTGSEEEEQVVSPISQAATSPRADFSSPAEFTPSLDTSAARHRMSVKPRNQRPSTKGMKLPTSAYRVRTESVNSLDRPLPEREEPEECGVSEETSLGRAYVLQTAGEALTSGEALAFRELPPVPSPVDPEEMLRGSGAKARAWEDEAPGPDERPEHEGLVTTNPLFLQPIPQGLLPSQPPPSPPFAAAEPFKPLDASIRNSSAHRLHKSRETKEMSGVAGSENTPGNDNAPALHPVSLERVSDAHEQPTKGSLAENVASASTDRRDSLSRNASPQPLNQAGSHSKPQPVPAPRARKPPAEARTVTSLKRSTEASSSGPENEPARPEPVLRATATPAGQEDSLPRETDTTRPQRPNSGSFRFFVSAEYRSRTPGEPAAKQEERKAGDAPAAKTPPAATDKEQEQPVHSVEETRPKELYWLQPSSQEKRSSAKREAPPCGIIKGTGENVPGKTEGGAEEAREREREERKDGAEDRRGAFRVKLRTTSASLKYRSEMSNPEVRSKRHSLEASEDQRGGHTGISSQAWRDDKDGSNSRGDVAGKASVVRKFPPQNSESPCTSPAPSAPAPGDTRNNESAGPLKAGDDIDLPQDPMIDSDRGSSARSASGPPREAETAGSEPAWMSLAREKTKSHHQLLTGKPASDTAAPEPAPQTTTQPRPAAQPRSQPRTRPVEQPPIQLPAKPAAQPTPQIVAQPTAQPLAQQAAPRPVPRGGADRPVSTMWRPDKAGARLGKAERTGLAEWTTDGANPADNKVYFKAAPMASITMEPMAPQKTIPNRCEGNTAGEQTTQILAPAAALTVKCEPSSPFSPSQQPSVLDRSQPSWMELAKRKSMAWSDKSLD